MDYSRPRHKRLRANQEIAVGEVVVDLSTAEVRDQPDYLTIDLLSKHVAHPLGRYINHSCAPNACISVSAEAVIATAQINAGDEITFNYLESEREIVAPFDCNCGAPRCQGRIEMPVAD